jgi:tetratricopeptide (TPR) repeat protein
MVPADLQEPRSSSQDPSPSADHAPGAPAIPERRAAGSDSLDDGVRAEMAGDLDRAAALFGVAANATDPAVAAEALTRLADVRRSRGEWESAIDAARRGRDIARASGLDPLVAHANIAEANALMCRGDFAAARTLFEQVLTLTVDARMRGLALQNLGAIMAQQGELGAAERYFAESYGQFQRAGYRRGEATALINYGRVTLDRGDPKLAEDLLCQAINVARDAEHAELMALATMNLAETRARLGDTAQAEDLASEALGVFSGCGNRWRQVECLRLIGAIHEQRGDAENATRCFERGLALAEEMGAAVEIRSLTDCLCRVSPRKRS